MGQYSIDLAWVREQALARRDDFDVMRYQLEYDDDLDDARLDALVERIATPIIAKIDCKACGNCCRALDVYVDEADVARLAKGLGASQDNFIRDYIDTERAEVMGEWGVFRHKPCAFLNGTLCRVYGHRPQSCRDYPVLTPYFRWIMEDMLDGAMLCPILYHVLEAMCEHVDAITRGEFDEL